MKNKTKFVMLLSLSMSILFGCSKQSNTNISEIEKQFSTAVPIRDMNESLSIVVDSKEQIFSLDSDIPLIVENRSSHLVKLDADTHVKLLINIDSQWMEVKNAITYSGSAMLSAQGKPLLNLQYTWVQPIVDESILVGGNTSFPLRIVIIGEVMEDELPTGQKVGAYVDVSLKPTEELIKPTDDIIYSTDESMKINGKIKGIITSADVAGKPLPNVILYLKYHPLFNENNQSEAIAMTKTDSRGRYSFDNVEPGIHSF